MKRKPQNKLPSNPLPCGCGVKGIRDWENAIETGYSLRVGWRDMHVVHCPMHNAAEKLLAALQEMVSLWERVHEKNGPVLLGRITLQNARAKIAEAMGK